MVFLVYSLWVTEFCIATDICCESGFGYLGNATLRLNANDKCRFNVPSMVLYSVLYTWEK